jgi:hypothetical protein
MPCTTDIDDGRPIPTPAHRWFTGPSQSATVRDPDEEVTCKT